jgi:monofunctional glycosyltransferase
MKIKQGCLYITFIITILSISIVTYYINEIRQARQETTQLISAAISEYGETLAIADLSKERETILLAIEDPAFRYHRGVDLSTPGAGMTTITQGMVKLLYFPDGFKQGIAKIRQTLIAQYAFDSLVSKDDQFNLFLNMTYFGNKNGKPIYGLENAAKAYYDKKYIALTDYEFLTLIAMLINPNKLKPGTKANKERVKRINQYLSGDYKPKAVLDFDYNNRKHGGLAEEALMIFLRLITDANPSDL